MEEVHEWIGYFDEYVRPLVEANDIALVAHFPRGPNPAHRTYGHVSDPAGRTSPQFSALASGFACADLAPDPQQWMRMWMQEYERIGPMDRIQVLEQCQSDEVIVPEALCQELDNALQQLVEFIGNEDDVFYFFAYERPVDWRWCMFGANKEVRAGANAGYNAIFAALWEGVDDWELARQLVIE